MMHGNRRGRRPNKLTSQQAIGIQCIYFNPRLPLETIAHAVGLTSHVLARASKSKSGRTLLDSLVRSFSPFDPLPEFVIEVAPPPAMQQLFNPPAVCASATEPFDYMTVFRGAREESDDGEGNVG